MGIAFALIFYAIVLAILASISSVVLGAFTWYLLRQCGPQRRRPLTIVALFPFACVVFAGAWFTAYATTNYEISHRDPMLGDTWQTPLPNGYALMMIDTTDQGTVYNPATQTSHGSVVSFTGKTDSAFGVRLLQVSHEHIFGARDSGYFNRIGQNAHNVDTWFELNTSTKTDVEYQSIDQLRAHAAAEGVKLALRPFAEVFNDFRMGWFDWTATIFLLLIPAIGFVALNRYVFRVHRSCHNQAVRLS